MPKPGYKSITIKEELLEKLKERAKQNNRSVPKELQTLIEKARKEA